MEKLLFVLSHKGKIKVDISKYTTMRLAYSDGNIWFGIDNHDPKKYSALRRIDAENYFDDKAFLEIPKNKQNLISNKKYSILIDKKLNEQDYVLQGILDIPEMQTYVQNEYNNILNFKREANEAKTEILYHIFNNDALNYEQKKHLERIANLVAENYRVNLTQNEQVILADFTNTGAGNDRELHFQLVQSKTDKNGKITKNYPEFCSEKIVAVMTSALRNNFNAINQHLTNLEIQNEQKTYQQSMKYCKMMDTFKPIKLEDIDKTLYN